MNALCSCPARAVPANWRELYMFIHIGTCQRTEQIKSNGLHLPDVSLFNRTCFRARALSYFTSHLSTLLGASTKSFHDSIMTNDILRQLRSYLRNPSYEGIEFSQNFRLPAWQNFAECIVEYYVSPYNSSCGEEENDECDSSSSSSDGDNSCITNNDSNYCESDDSREPQYNNKFENSNNVGGEDKKANKHGSRRIQTTKVSYNQYTAKTKKADYPFHNSNNCSSTNETKIHNLDDYKENADEHQDNFHEEGDEDQDDSDGEDQDDTDNDDDGDTDDDDDDNCAIFIVFYGIVKKDLWTAYEWTWDIADFFCEKDSLSPLK